MILVKQQQVKFQPEIGDFIFDTENLIYSYFELTDMTLIFPLEFFGNFNLFVTLRRLEVNDKDLLMKSSKYECPFLNRNTYYGLLPVAIQTNNSRVYRSGPFARSEYDYVFDLEWQKKNRKSIIQNEILTSFMGSGYTDSFLPSDGGHKIVNVKIELSNNEKEAAEFEKQKLILQGEGEAAKKRAIMSADGALDKKLQAWIQVNQNYAEALKGTQLVPSIVMGNSDATKGGSGATALLDLLMVKTAKDLSLDMTVPKGGN